MRIDRAKAKAYEKAIHESTKPGARRDVLLHRRCLGREVIPRPRDYMEAFLWIEDKRTEVPVQWTFNRAQRVVDYLLYRKERAREVARFAQLKARQFGVSTFWLGRGVEKITRVDNAKAAIVADTDENAGKLLDQGKYMIAHLPHSLPRKRDNRSVLILEEPFRSRLTIASAKRKNPLRGFTYHFIHCTESAFWDDALVKLRGVNGAFAKAPGAVISHETTANGIDNWFYDFWWAGRRGENDQMALFFPWWFDPDFDYYTPVTEYDVEAIVETLTDEERDLLEKGLCFEQLKWRRDIIRSEYFGDEDGFRQEYPSIPEEAFLASGRPVFVPKYVVKVLNRCPDPIWIGDVHIEWHSEEWVEVKLVPNARGALKIWKHPEEYHHYAIGVDSGHGVQDGDYSVASGIDMHTHEQVFEFAERINSIDFGRICAALGWRWHEAYIMPEMEGPGMATFQAMADCGYPNVALRPVYDTQGTFRTRKYGWSTNARSKPVLINVLREDLYLQAVEGEPGINSRDCCRQLAGYQLTDRQTYAAERGKHDDRLIARGIAVIAARDAVEDGIVPPEPKSEPWTVEERHWAEYHRDLEDQEEGQPTTEELAEYQALEWS